ncbi:MAG: M48 family metallopeptidase [Candidatus Omnitrophica bacterium]|nr:M48 family metallopeptidase [Candidatus Omnitrophota bacterium]
MKYVPREINDDDDNVNVSKDDPLQTMFKALIGLGILFFLAFAILAGISEFMIRCMPNKVNDSLAVVFSSNIKTPERLEPERAKLQSLLDKLVPHTDFEGDPFRVEIIAADYKNAMAFPGRKIAFTTELLKDLNTENEVVMILGHELGHYHNSDHLRSLSRGVILMGLFQLLEVGGVGSASQLVSGSANIYNLKYSRGQESRADAFGLNLLHQYYGHVAGAVSTFEHLYREEEETRTMNGVFSTHPITKKRIRGLRSLIKIHAFSLPEDEALIPYTFIDPQSNDDGSDEDPAEPEDIP